MKKLLTVPEEMLLTAIWRLRDDAYGVTIRHKIEEVTGRDIGYGTLYNILAQLHRKGYVSRSRSVPTAERGGRCKIYYSLTPKGMGSLRESRELHHLIWHNLPELVSGRG